MQDLQTTTAWAPEGKFRSLLELPLGGPGLEEFADQWMETAFASGLRPLGKAAELIGKHAEGILNYIFHSITNAASEGINSTIKNLKHAARGLPVFYIFSSPGRRCGNQRRYSSFLLQYATSSHLKSILSRPFHYKRRSRETFMFFSTRASPASHKTAAARRCHTPPTPRSVHPRRFPRRNPPAPRAPSPAIPRMSS